MTPRCLLVVGCLGFVLIGAGCRSAYVVERLLWQAERLAERIDQDRDGATSEQFAAARAAFAKVIEEAPGTTWAARSRMAVGSLFAIQGAYGEARDVFADITLSYASFRGVALAARVATAHTYKVEQDWDAVAAAYREIAEYHPWTGEGLAAPLYVAWLYAKHGQTEQADQAYQKAEVHYTDLIRNAPTPESTAAATRYLEAARARADIPRVDHRPVPSPSP